MLGTFLTGVLLCHPVLAFFAVLSSKKRMQPSNIPLIAWSFLAIFVLRCACFLAPNNVPLALCVTNDQPNPIASIYPGNATGTLNGTIAVLPISLELARLLIPLQYGILEHAYRALLPSFPQGMYPAIVQALHDHDVQAFGYNIADFSRTGIEFPFVDLLNDNHTSFKWAPALLMTSGHDIALNGAREYGTDTFPASFKPGCDAYQSVHQAQDPRTTHFSAKSDDGVAYLSTLFSASEKELYPLQFFKNFTNQPTFADGKSCDNMSRLFNTSVTVAPNGIERVKGTVRARIPPFTSEQEWPAVYGLRLDTAFIENNYIDCENFRGYSGYE